jgi:fucose permease
MTHMVARSPKNGSASLLIIAFYSFVLIGLPLGVLNIAWTYMQGTFDVSLDALGILLGAGTVGRMIMAFISGRVVARTGLGLFLIGGSALAGLGGVGFVVSPVWAMLLVSACVASMGSGSIDAGINTFMSARYKTSHLNLVHACFGLGLTIGPQLVSLIVERLHQSWRWAYVLVVALQIGLAILFFLTRHRWEIDQHEDDPGTARPGIGTIRIGARLVETLALPVVLFVLLVFFAYGGAELGTGQLSNTLLVEKRGIGSEEASFWISVYWASFTIGRIVVGTVARRLTNRQLLRLCMGGAIAGAFLLWLDLSNGVSLGGLVVMGMALAPIFPTLIAETPGRVGLRHTANAVGFQIGFAGLGAAILPGVAGIVANAIGLEFIALFLVIDAVSMAFLYEFVLLNETRTSPVPNAPK